MNNIIKNIILAALRAEAERAFIFGAEGSVPVEVSHSEGRGRSWFVYHGEAVATRDADGNIHLSEVSIF